MRSVKLLALMMAPFAAQVAFAQAPKPAAPPAPNTENILNLDLSTGGRVVIELRPDKAPNSVERVRILAKRGFYDGLTFHRVIPGFMAQGGDPKGTGAGGSDLPDLKAEFNDLPHVRGTLSLARADAADSANSQFFIVLSPTLSLDKNYTAIGRVVSGMAYADALEPGEPPANPSRILHASIGNAPPYVAPPPAPVPVPAPVAAPVPKVKAVPGPTKLSPKATIRR